MSFLSRYVDVVYLSFKTITNESSCSWITVGCRLPLINLQLKLAWPQNRSNNYCIIL